MARIDVTNLEIVELHRTAPRTLETGIKDNKGRRITAEAIRGVELVVGTDRKLYWAQVQACRDYQDYGRIQDTIRFDNEAERNAYVEKRFDDILSYATKKFANATKKFAK